MSSIENNTSSSSALVAASTQGANGRTTRAMKAEENASNSQRTDTTNIAPEGTTAAQIPKVDKEIDPTSHLSTKDLSSGKVLANSNGKPEREQATIDSELEKRLRAEKLKPFLWATQVDPVSKESMPKDLVAMGYSTAAAKNLIKLKEPLRVDGCSQRPCAGYGKHVAGTGTSPQKKKKPSTRGQPKYEALVLFAGQDWVLFDPLKGYPVAMEQPPVAAARWERFAPGNARILSQNPKTKTIRSQATPAALSGLTVHYTASGPRIDDWTPIGASKKTAPPPAPAPAPSPSPGPAPPALGRGAVRKVRKTSPAPEPSKAASKKRKADEISISADPEPQSAREPSAAAEEVVAPGGEEKQRKKRRPVRPKISAARVEDSSSE